MRVVQRQPIRVTCNLCATLLETDDEALFRESNTMPPTVHFMCPNCEQMASIPGCDAPARLRSKLVEDR